MPSADGTFEKTMIERRGLGPLDVQIEIKYAGICHSDIHTARNEWGNAAYSVVPGHEIAGVVTAVGKEVTRHEVGDRVGVGCFVDSCGTCEACGKGEEQYCAKGVVQTHNYPVGDEVHQGRLLDPDRRDRAFRRLDPRGLGLDVAAPLLCCGITLYSPLRYWNVGKARASRSSDCRQFGADHYYATSDPETFETLQDSFDLILRRDQSAADGAGPGLCRYPALRR